jgi:uncharacterized protein YecE (DUF72 family)
MIRVGIGGWTFEPWRGVFYPKGLPHARELEYAAQHLTSIEVNGTYYGSQKPESFRRWAAETPDGFVFSLKGPRFATNRRVLAEAGDSIKRFMDSGVTELKDKLGPILWQFAPTKKFEPADFSAFLALLPHESAGLRVRHVVEVRHESFVTADFVKLARAAKVAIVLADSEKFPLIPDVTADFVYARLQCAAETVATGYTTRALDQWAARARAWEKGSAPDDLESLAGKPPERKAREVFIYMINGAKVRAPAAAMALIERVT